MRKTNSWDDHWAEIRAKTETQKVKRTETQRIARIESQDAKCQRRDAHESGLKAGYAECIAEVMSYLRHADHYRIPVDVKLFEDFYQRIKKWRRCPDSGPPPKLIWERQGKFGN